MKVSEAVVIVVVRVTRQLDLKPETSRWLPGCRGWRSCRCSLDLRRLSCKVATPCFRSTFIVCSPLCLSEPLTASLTLPLCLYSWLCVCQHNSWCQCGLWGRLGLAGWPTVDDRRDKIRAPGGGDMTGEYLPETET